MISSYPPTDALDDFFDPDDLLACIREESIGPVKKAINIAGLLYIQNDKGRRFLSAQATGLSGSLAEGLATSMKSLKEALGNFLNSPGQGKVFCDGGKTLALRAVAAPRYWKPHDPVVLLSETATDNQSALLHNNRYAMPGAEEIQECKLLDSIVPDPANFSYKEALAACDQVREALKDEPLPGNADRTEIWNPIMMEWAVEYLPAHPRTNQASDDRKYAVDYVRHLYSLLESDADLSFLADETTFQNGVIYSGTSILTPYAGLSLGSAISSFADPLGFPKYQSFSVDEVAPLVGSENLFAPRPFDDFHPIRNGLLKIVNLRLVDSFGQTLSIREPGFVVSEPLKAGEVKNFAHLKPRFCQAARLNFRFLQPAFALPLLRSSILLPC